MTNRQVWEQRILSMTDEEFSHLMMNPDNQREYGIQFCAWCKAVKHPKTCENCSADDIEYLRAEAMA